MFIKRFEAPTLLQAVEQVRTELGSDAVILSTRTLKTKSWLPWLRRSAFEVIAAKDSADDAIAPLPERQLARSAQAPPRPPVARVQAAGLDVVLDGSTITGPAEQPVAPSAGPAEGAEPPVSPSSSDISAYLQPMMHEIEKLKAQMTQALAPHVPSQPHAPQAAGVTYLQELLIARGVKASSASRLTQRLIGESSRADLHDPGRAYARARDVLRTLLAESREWGDCFDEGPRRIAFIGPTGVGKTTTIAKLAARYSLMQNKTVSLVAADTYRIAAVSQLKMYGELLGVEVDVVHSPQEMAAVVENRVNKDVVLIDTAGRSQRNGQSLESLEGLLRAAKPTEIHLVLSATTKAADLEDIVTRFGPLGYDRLLFSKIDESDSFGEMLDAILACDTPVSFLTTGQNVPNDIEVSTADRVMSLLLPDVAGGRELEHGRPS